MPSYQQLTDNRPWQGAADRVWPRLHLRCSQSSSIPPRVSFVSSSRQGYLELYPSAALYLPLVHASSLLRFNRATNPRSESRQDLTASCARLSSQGFAVVLPTCPFAPDLHHYPCSHTSPHQPVPQSTACTVHSVPRKHRQAGKLEFSRRQFMN